METATKLKRGPRKGSLNMIDVPLIDLIKMFAANATIKVGRRWIEAQGWKPDMEIPPLSVVLAQQVQEKTPAVVDIKTDVPVSNLKLNVVDPEDLED